MATEITPDDLVSRVEKAQGKIAIASLWELRSAYKRGRMTPGVLAFIENRLQQDHRLGLVPENPDEPSQDQSAYLYALDSPIAALLDSAFTPTENGLRRLREVATPARDAAVADQNLATVQAALEDATAALRVFMGQAPEA